jgi:membrane protease YdiL (CAAX protease family)
VRMILHLAVPFALQATARHGWPRGRSAVLAAYDAATMLIASSAAGRGTPMTPPPRRPLPGGVVRVVCGGVVGAALPCVVRRALRTSSGGAAAPRALRALRAAPPVVVPAVRTALVAAAEEAIWRSPLRWTDHGRRGAAAAVGTSVAGFALLHLPVGGPHALPYTALVGAVASAFALGWGTPPAVAFHVAHNLVFLRRAPGGPARSARTTAAEERVRVVEIPSEATW